MNTTSSSTLSAMDLSSAPLRRFLRDSSEDAFREIVDAHIGLVYHAALRRCGGDSALARDAAQTVFTDLARQAARLREPAALSGWLYRHTCYVTAKLVRSESRRRTREDTAAREFLTTAAAGTADGADGAALWRDVAPVLEEAMERLPEADRRALVLRYLEGRGLRETGELLGLSENTARMRVARALEKLRAALERRGVRGSVAALGVSLGLAGAARAPEGLARSLTWSALQSGGAAAAAALVPAAVWKTAAVLAAAGALAVPTVNALRSGEKPTAAAAAPGDRSMAAVPPLPRVRISTPVKKESGVNFRPALAAAQLPPAVSAEPPTAPDPAPAPPAPDPAAAPPVPAPAVIAPAPAEDTVEVTKLTLGVVPAVMKFAPNHLEVRAGAKVMLLFRNDKCPLQHNFLLLKPGAMNAVGALADAMLTDPDAMAKHYLPVSADILVKGNKLIGPGQSDLIEFTAPSEPGDYPFVCTFPGHWRLMNGVLKVTQ